MSNQNRSQVAEKENKRVSDKANAKAVEADSREDEAKFQSDKEKRSSKALEIASKAGEGKKLTKGEEKLLKKSPAIRLLVKQELKKQGLNIEKVYVDVLKDSYKESKDPDVRTDIRLKHRRFVANELAAFAGLHATADDKKRPDTTINIIVSKGLHMRIPEDQDGYRSEIRPVPEAGEASRDEARSEDSPSGVWKKGG